MKITKQFIFILIFFLSSNTYIYANQNYMFLNIDLLIKNTNIGKISLNKISNIDKKNLKKLNEYEAELENNKRKRKILLTIDDGFMSFYKNVIESLKDQKKKQNFQQHIIR